MGFLHGDSSEFRWRHLEACLRLLDGAFRMAISFKWLLLHYALPVGFHLKGQVDDRHCVSCQLQEETLKHLFWTCIATRQYWGRILRMFSCKYRGAIFTWGAVFWGSLDVQVSNWLIIVLSKHYLESNCYECKVWLHN